MRRTRTLCCTALLTVIAAATGCASGSAAPLSRVSDSEDGPRLREIEDSVRAEDAYQDTVATGEEAARVAGLRDAVVDGIQERERLEMERLEAIAERLRKRREQKSPKE